MSFIYGIFNNDVCLYIGSTKDSKRRYKQHIDALRKGKHSNKTLQKKYDECNGEVEFRVLYTLHTDERMAYEFMEMLVNSYYKPKCNKALLQQGRNRIIFPRLKENNAERLISCMVQMYCM